jgi:hypothetical protein
MAGSISQNENFAAGQRVTADRLNNLVDNAVIRPLAVTGAMIADNAIETRHVGNLELSIANMAMSDGKLLGGNSEGVATEYGMGTSFEIDGSDLKLKAGGVAATHLADASIPSTKLTAVGTAGVYGSGTAIPTITTDVAGRVTAVTTTAVAIPTVTQVALAIPSAGSVTTSGTAITSASLVGIYLKNISTESGYAAGDLVSINASYSNLASTCLSCTYTVDGYCKVALTSGVTPNILHRNTGAAATFTPSKWNVVFNLLR